MRDAREARPFVNTEIKIRKIKTMSESDSSESGGEGSCTGDSASACPSGYMPIEGRIRSATRPLERAGVAKR